MKKNTEELAEILSDINSPKEKLMILANRLEEIGEYKKAEKLNILISKLEALQN